MERKKTGLQGAMAGAGLLILIFDSSLALEGARTGMDLCIRTVIPSLFPFFVLSAILTNSLKNYGASKLQVVSGFLGIPPSAASVLIPSFLGGYPVGAKCVGDLYQKHQISKTDAERLLSFCSNAGPSFLFGMVSGFFPERKCIWLLWFIHVLSALLTAIAIPPKAQSGCSLLPEKKPREEAIIWSAAKAMGMVCCWVVLFRMVITFLNAWLFWLFPVWIKVLLVGLLELTNGCCELLLISDVNLRFVVCSCMLSFGGICVLFQTSAVTNGLSLGYYVKGKFLQAAFSLLISSWIVFKQDLLLLTVIPVLVILLRKSQKRYRNPNALPV